MNNHDEKDGKDGNSRYGKHGDKLKALLLKVVALTPEQIDQLASYDQLERRNFAFPTCELTPEFGKATETFYRVLITGQEIFMGSKDFGDFLPKIQSAWMVIADAITGICFQDFISTEIFDLYYDPWQKVMEDQDMGKRDQDTGKKDQDGFDQDGFDKWGFDREGFDKDGFDRFGFNRQGLDIHGYSREDFEDDEYVKEDFQDE